MPDKPASDDRQPWHKTLTRLLAPLGIRTFEARSGPEAVDLIEKNPIHLAVVDTRLPTIGGLDLCRLIQRLNDQATPSPVTGSFNLHMKVEETVTPERTERRIEVRFDARPAQKTTGGPAVILIAPPPQHQDPQLLQDALKFNAFSVLSEPVDVNLALEVMARALKRFHQNQWPV